MMLVTNELTPQQRSALRADIAAKAQPGQPLNALYAANDFDGIAAWYEATESPTFTVWKTSVSLSDVGQAFVATGLAAMTSANNDRLVSFALWNPAGVAPHRADHRQFFADVFSPTSGASTRAALDALWRRPASRLEKLFAVGTGSDASPATLTYDQGRDGALDGAYIFALVRE